MLKLFDIPEDTRKPIRTILKKIHCFIGFNPVFGMDSEYCLPRIRRFKNPETVKDKRYAQRAASYTILKYWQLFGYKKDHLVIVVPSTSWISKYIVKVLTESSPYCGRVLHNALRKNTVNELEIRWEELMGRDLPTQEMFPKCFEQYKETYGNEPAQVKWFRACWRRFIKNLFSLNINPELIAGKDILLIDDTVGDGCTLFNAQETLLAAGARSVDCIAITRDYTMDTRPAKGA